MRWPWTRSPKHYGRPVFSDPATLEVSIPLPAELLDASDPRVLDYANEQAVLLVSKAVRERMPNYNPRDFVAREFDAGFDNDLRLSTKAQQLFDLAAEMESGGTKDDTRLLVFADRLREIVRA